MTQEIPEAAANLAVSTWKSFTGKERFSLTLGSIVCGLLAMGLSRILHVPGETGVAGSMLQQQTWWLAIFVAWVVIIGGAVLGAVFTLRLHYDAGLFCGGIGLAVLSVRFGSIKYTLFNAAGPGVYLSMAIELVLLWTAVYVAWQVLLRLSMRNILTQEVILDPTEPDLTIDQKILATLSQAMLMVILLLLLCRSDTKAQIIASVGIAGYLGALGGHHFIPTRPSVWFWTAPLLVGLFGYIMQYFTPSTNWLIGDVHGFFGPLARPTPLDYISMGTAGTVLGYWTSQQWHHEAIATTEPT